MDADGTNIHQISFNQSHDLDPAVLPNGRIVYTRWEHHIDDNQFDLYSVNPDGSDLQLLYGANSHATGTVDPTTSQPSIIQFMSPRPMQDGRTLTLVRPFTGTGEGGDLVLIDTQNFVDNTAPVASSAGMPGPAQMRALPTDVRTIEGPSPGGRYRSAAPLFDGSDRLLVSWSQCRLLEDTRIVPCTSDRLSNPDAVEAPPLFGIYIYDVRENTQQPVVVPQEGFIYTEVVAGSPRVLPPVILDRAAGVDFPQDLLTEGVGVLHIRSVYDIDGVDQAPGGIAAVRNPANAAYATRPARFLRIEKAVSQPDDDTRDIDEHRVRSEPRARHARHPRLRADRAGRLGESESAGQRGVQHQRARRARPSSRRRARQPPHELAAGACRARQLDCNGCHNANATPPLAHGRAGLTDFRERGRADDRQPVPEHQCGVVRRRRRDDGRSPQPRHVRRRLRAERRPGVPGLLAGDAGHDAFGRCLLLGRPVDRAVRSRPIRPSTCHLRERAAAARRCRSAASCTSNWTQPVPHHHPLRDAHPPAVGHGPLRRCEQRRHAGSRSGDDAADQSQVHQLSCAGQRRGHDGRAGRRPRPDRRPVRRRSPTSSARIASCCSATSARS